MNQELKNSGAWKKMMEIAKDDSVVSHHSVYNPIPYKLSRCIGLKTGEKAVLNDIIGYMGSKDQCYPNIEANPYLILSETLHRINHVMRKSRIENERKQIDKIRKIVKSDIYTEAIGKLLFIYDFRLTHRGGADSWLEMYRDDLVKFINAVHDELEVDYGFSHIFSDRKEFHTLILNEE